VLTSPFTGGWLGDFGWYGGSGNPPLGNVTLHDPWSFYYYFIPYVEDTLLFTASFSLMVLLPMAVGAVFLIPLLRKSVRNAFVPSLFLYITGMLTMTSGIFRGLAEAIAVQFGQKEIQFGITIETVADFLGYPMANMTVLLPIMLLLFVIFAAVGWRLAGVHYPGNRTARKVVLLYITATYWLSFLSMLIFAWV
jgi:hypothetical protein